MGKNFAKLISSLLRDHAEFSSLWFWFFVSEKHIKETATRKSFGGSLKHMGISIEILISIFYS